MIPRFIEETAAWIEFTVRDKDGDLMVPTNLAYQIDCATTGAAILASTPVTPASSGEIAVTPTDTTLQSQNNVSELRVMTVTANAGLANKHIEVFQFEVENRTAVT